MMIYLFEVNGSEIYQLLSMAYLNEHGAVPALSRGSFDEAPFHVLGDSFQLWPPGLFSLIFNFLFLAYTSGLLDFLLLLLGL